MILGIFGLMRLFDSIVYTGVFLFYWTLLIIANKEEPPVNEAEKSADKIANRLYGWGMVISGIAAFCNATGIPENHLVYLLSHILAMAWAVFILGTQFVIWGVSSGGTKKQAIVGFCAFIVAVVAFFCQVATFFV